LDPNNLPSGVEGLSDTTLEVEAWALWRDLDDINENPFSLFVLSFEKGRRGSSVGGVTMGDLSKDVEGEWGVGGRDLSMEEPRRREEREERERLWGTFGLLGEVGAASESVDWAAAIVRWSPFEPDLRERSETTDRRRRGSSSPSVPWPEEERFEEEMTRRKKAPGPGEVERGSSVGRGVVDRCETGDWDPASRRCGRDPSKERREVEDPRLRSPKGWQDAIESDDRSCSSSSLGGCFLVTVRGDDAFSPWSCSATWTSLSCATTGTTMAGGTTLVLFDAVSPDPTLKRLAKSNILSAPPIPRSNSNIGAPSLLGSSFTFVLVKRDDEPNDDSMVRSET
jgi:hypothetical protein